MITPRMAMAFWSTVDDCLVEFFRLSPEQARRVTESYRSYLASLYLQEPDPFPDMIYHSEPIYIAFNLMQKDIPFDSERYDCIQEENLIKSRKRNSLMTSKVAAFREELASRRSRPETRRRHVKSETAPSASNRHKVLTSA